MIHNQIKKDRVRFVVYLVLIIFFILAIIVFTNPSLKSKITGQVLATVYVRSATYLNCSLTLESGWNLVSNPCFNNTDAAAYVASYLHATRIFAYDADRPNDPWRSYSPNLGSQFTQDLATISRLDGYYIYVSTGRQFNMTSFLSPPYSIDLNVGWNLVGYPNLTTNGINASTSSIFGNYILIRTMNNTNKTYMYYVYGDENSTLNYTYPYQGYWFNMSSADNWVVD